MSPVEQIDEATRLERRRKRSLAIAFALVIVVVTFFALTIVKLGPGLFDRPL